MLPEVEHFRDLGHTFSLYGLPSRQITYIYYQLVPVRPGWSKKSPVALSVAVSTNVGFFAKRFERIHIPRRDGSGFLGFVHRKYST